MSNRHPKKSSWLVLSHSTGVAILARSPSNYSHTTWRSTTHCSGFCWTCCMHSFVAFLWSSAICLSAYSPYICMSFPSISAVMVKASSIQGWTHALRKASFCLATSTCSFSALTCCILARLWERMTLCVVPLILSYCCCSTHASVSRHYMLGSSCKDVRTSNAWSNISVPSCTTLPISANPVWIVLTRCSLTSRGVAGCAFICSLAIWRFSSNCTHVVSSRVLQTQLSRQWIRISVGRSVTMDNSRACWHASSNFCVIYRFCDTSS